MPTSPIATAGGIGSASKGGHSAAFGGSARRRLGRDRARGGDAEPEPGACREACDRAQRRAQGQGRSGSAKEATPLPSARNIAAAAEASEPSGSATR